jgi:hypothetical protein
MRDVAHLLDAGAPVFAVGGSGRLADALDTGLADPAVRTIGSSTLVEVLPAVDDVDLLRSRLGAALRARDGDR